jgi:hypothetical protein
MPASSFRYQSTTPQTLAEVGEGGKVCRLMAFVSLQCPNNAECRDLEGGVVGPAGRTCDCSLGAAFDFRLVFLHQCAARVWRLV